MKSTLAVFLLFLLTLTTSAYAVEKLPVSLIPLTSKPGLVLFKKDWNENTIKLLTHFVTQKTNAYCGIASAVMILNAMNITPPIDSEHVPYRYFNQNNFFNEQIKKIITLQEIQKNGISLSELNTIMQNSGVKSMPYFANDINLNEFRKILTHAIARNQFIIVNFSRTKLNQQGNGHYSPLTAYDKEQDRFLMLDVSRYKYPAYWVKTSDLWNAVNTKDNDRYRGFIIIK